MVIINIERITVYTFLVFIEKVSPHHFKLGSVKLIEYLPGMSSPPIK